MHPGLPSSIAFMGDPHGDFGPALALPDGAARHLILLGDMDAPEPLDRIAARLPARLWWIPGNHEFDSVAHHDRVYVPELAARNLHGRVVEIEGLRVAGLGGVFRGKLWYPKQGTERPRYSRHAEALAALAPRHRWRGGLPLRQRGAIWPEDIEALATQRADVLVCHEAPSCHPHGFAAIDELARALGVRLVVHGHHHEHYRATIADGRIEVVGLALGQIWHPNGGQVERRE